MSISRVYFSIGSNIDPDKHIQLAVQKIQSDFSEICISNVYQNPAIGFEGDDFLNLVISIETESSVSEMLDYANQLELAAGRVRISRGRYDSRTLDVDLILFADLVGVHNGRSWPNEDIDQAHVLKPLVDIAGDQCHPINGRTYSALWDEFDKGAVQLTKIEFSPKLINE